MRFGRLAGGGIAPQITQTDPDFPSGIWVIGPHYELYLKTRPRAARSARRVAGAPGKGQPGSRIMLWSDR